MAVALVAHAAAKSTGASTGCTTAAIDTTGADLIIVACGTYSATPGLLSDSAGNTWTYLNQIGGASQGDFRFAFCKAPITSAAHTFSSAKSGYQSIAVAAFSGTGGASVVVDQQAGSTAGDNSTGTTSYPPGNISPVQDGELLVTALVSGGSGTPTTPSGFTLIDYIQWVNGVNMGIALAWQVQGAKATVNPTWTTPSNWPNTVPVVASFEVASGGASASRTGTDMVAFSDVGTVAASRPRSGANVLAVADAGVAAVGRPRAGAEAVAFSDAGTRSAGRPRGGADAVAISEANVAQGGRTRTGVDAVAVSDAGARAAQAAARGGADALAIADAGAKRGAASRTGADSVTFGEANVVQRGRTSTGSDAVSIGDAGGRLGVWARGGVDTVAVGDVGARGPSSQARGGFEAVALTDQGLVARSLVRGGTESWTISDTAITIVPTIIRGIVTGEAAGGMLTGGNAAQRVATGTAAGGSSGRAATPLYTGP